MPEPFDDSESLGIMPLLFSYDEIPLNMLDSYPLRALAYTGYDVQWLKDRGLLYDPSYIGKYLEQNAPDVLSGIHYSGVVYGTEAVASSETVTGSKPDLDRFLEKGMDCTAFAAYYYFNYLYRVENISNATRTKLENMWNNCFRGRPSIVMPSVTVRRTSTQFVKDTIEKVEDEHFITIHHPMTKERYRLLLSASILYSLSCLFTPKPTEIPVF